MSWFGMMRSEKTVWDSQEYVTNILTGGIFGQILFDKVIKNNSLYQKIKEATANFFCSQLSHPLDQPSEKISAKILEKVVRHKKFSGFFPGLFKRLHAQQTPGHKMPHGSITHNEARGLLEYIIKKNIPGEAIALSHTLKTFKRDEEVIKNLFQKRLKEALQPATKKIIHASLIAMVKISTEQAIDTGVLRILSMSTIVAAFLLSSRIFETIAQVFKNYAFSQRLLHLIKQLPHASTIFRISACCHLAEMGIILIKVLFFKPKDEEQEKKALKALVRQFIDIPIKEELHAAEIFQLLKKFELTELDFLTDVLVDEAIDLSWNDLQKIKFLGLPLVS